MSGLVHVYSSCSAVAAPVLRPSDIGGTITVVPVPKVVTNYSGFEAL